MAITRDYQVCTGRYGAGDHLIVAGIGGYHRRYSIRRHQTGNVAIVRQHLSGGLPDHDETFCRSGPDQNFSQFLK
jgi:hypothetical protein